MCFLAILILFLLIQLRGPRNAIVPTSIPQIPALCYYPEGIKILHQNELRVLALYMWSLCYYPASHQWTLNTSLSVPSRKSLILLSVFPTLFLVNWHTGHPTIQCIFLSGSLKLGVPQNSLFSYAIHMLSLVDLMDFPTFKIVDHVQIYIQLWLMAPLPWPLDWHIQRPTLLSPGCLWQRPGRCSSNPVPLPGHTGRL